tara:strand:- start:11042 stop:12025 length:984 start_codon:yes stop_codon:yes gene_type:complete
LKEPKEDEKGFALMLKTVKLDRKREKRDRSLMGRALLSYAQCKSQSKFLLRFSQKEINKMSPSELIAIYKTVVEYYKTEISYVGNVSLNDIKSALEKEVDLFSNDKEEPYLERERAPLSKNKVIIVHDKKAIQSQVYFYIPDDKRDFSEYAKLKAFNSYFAGGFSGIITQEIREYRSLAYSTGGGYIFPVKSNAFFYGYIGCQADKTIKAITVLDSLMNNMPQKPERINSLQKSLKLSTVSSYPNFKKLDEHISYYQNQGFKQDPNIDAYQQYENLTMDQIVKFYESSIKGKPRVITIYGDKSKMDQDQLKQFGEVEIIQLKEVIKF